MTKQILKKELAVAIVMLLVAAIALTGSTFAWFAINNTVTATGMSITTSTSNNLFIKDIAADATSVTDDGFTTSRSGEINALLEPVSTVDGENFFYTSTHNVVGNGDAETDTYIDYATTGLGAATDSTNFANAFSENYEVTKTLAADGAKGYVDYVLCLKAVNAKSVPYYINMTSLVLAYVNKTDSGDKAYRVAVFTEKGTTTDTGATFPATPAPTLLSILAPTNSAEFTDGYAVSAIDSAPTAINSAMDDAVAITVAANSTEYYRVTVRMWLEGEDTTCNNTTFADLDSSWNLILRFDLQDTTGGVTAMQKMATQTANSVTYYYDGTNYYTELGEAALTGADLTAAQAAFAE